MKKWIKTCIINKEKKKMDTIEKLAYKISEGIQSSSLRKEGEQMNVFHRTVATHESSDLSFIIGLVSAGLRGSTLLEGEK